MALYIFMATCRSCGKEKFFYSDDHKRHLELMQEKLEFLPCDCSNGKRKAKKHKDVIVSKVIKPEKYADKSRSGWIFKDHTDVDAGVSKVPLKRDFEREKASFLTWHWVETIYPPEHVVSVRPWDSMSHAKWPKYEQEQGEIKIDSPHKTHFKK